MDGTYLGEEPFMLVSVMGPINGRYLIMWRPKDLRFQQCMTSWVPLGTLMLLIKIFPYFGKTMKDSEATFPLSVRTACNIKPSESKEEWGDVLPRQPGQSTLVYDDVVKNYLLREIRQLRTMGKHFEVVRELVDRGLAPHWSTINVDDLQVAKLLKISVIELLGQPTTTFNWIRLHEEPLTLPTDPLIAEVFHPPEYGDRATPVTRLNTFEMTDEHDGPPDTFQGSPSSYNYQLDLQLPINGTTDQFDPALSSGILDLSHLVPGSGDLMAQGSQEFNLDELFNSP